MLFGVIDIIMLCSGHFDSESILFHPKMLLLHLTKTY